MIPDFKTYIGESVWADIHKRSNGEQERKEDIINVNEMDPTEFYKYLIDTYETKDFPNYLYGIKMSSTFKYIDVPVLQCPDEDSIIYGIDYEFFTDNKRLTMSYFVEKYFPELFAKMKEVYDVKSVTHAQAIYNKKTTIKPLDGSECTNSFLINVIEFILKNGPKERIILSHK